ncbi:MAG: ABC transporter permease, partial [Desulfofustis sp.]
MLVDRTVSPARRKWQRFRKNRRGFYSLVIFLVLFVFSLAAELISNDKPFFVVYQGEYYFPIFRVYPETTFGGIFETEADYKDPFFIELKQEDQNRAFFPPNRHKNDTINYALDVPVPSPPTKENI